MGKQGEIMVQSSSSELGKRPPKPKQIFDPSPSGSQPRKPVNSKGNQRPNHHKPRPSNGKNLQQNTAQSQNQVPVPSKAVVYSKLQATERTKKISLVTTDGGIVVEFNAGFYEIFKRLLFQAFTEADGLSLDGRAMQSQTSTPQNAPHQYTSTIRVSSQDIITKDVASYTINFYHSKCKVLVNGKGESQFPQDLKLVVQNISRKQE